MTENNYPPLPELSGDGISWGIYTSDQMRAYADEARAPLLARIAELEHQLAEAKQDSDSKQARIDELMLEFCPNEMTPEQFNEWARSQVPAESHCHASHVCDCQEAGVECQRKEAK